MRIGDEEDRRVLEEEPYTLLARVTGVGAFLYGLVYAAPVTVLHKGGVCVKDAHVDRGSCVVKLTKDVTRR